MLNSKAINGSWQQVEAEPGFFFLRQTNHYNYNETSKKNLEGNMRSSNSN